MTLRMPCRWLWVENPGYTRTTRNRVFSAILSGMGVMMLVVKERAKIEPMVIFLGTCTGPE